jgi:hypothetical protein
MVKLTYKNVKMAIRTILNEVNQNMFLIKETFSRGIEI